MYALNESNLLLITNKVGVSSYSINAFSFRVCISYIPLKPPPLRPF